MYTEKISLHPFYRITTKSTTNTNKTRIKIRKKFYYLLKER